MIFVSTSGFPDLTASDTADIFVSWGINAIELSGGAYSPDLYQSLLDKSEKVIFQLHNYFPPAENPFVFNLASLDESVADLSIKHVENSVRWAVDFKRPIFSFHAGYRIDPVPAELGKVIKKSGLFSRHESLNRFIDRVNSLAEFAMREGVELLIENNVLSRDNYIHFGEDPFLMTEPGETGFIMKNTPQNVNLLIDLGHLKVSANILGYDPSDMLTLCDAWIKGYHLNENDGFSDTNDPVKTDSWFWPYLKNNMNYYSLEIKGCSEQLIREQLALLTGIILRQR
jgi:sugar phosphate isomerase/epimerase